MGKKQNIWEMYGIYIYRHGYEGVSPMGGQNARRAIHIYD